ncbi:hypothetical protein DB30_02432 [Enhygromyxa salina]|uniref:Uncharacterized protein n=1 Tax=Enhygromyxa salina TaxID=215803 RepID=A0A0C2CQ02_9BACT|nr:hypothetical protein DB30_02432 [Enhygromyxa salina]
MQIDDDDGNWPRFAQDAFWLADVYVSAGKSDHATLPLRAGLEMAIRHDLRSQAMQFEVALAEIER